jgi:hypothetical protein
VFRPLAVRVLRTPEVTISAHDGAESSCVDEM